MMFYTSCWQQVLLAKQFLATITMEHHMLDRLTCVEITQF